MHFYRFIENGSLSTVYKKFGNFSESLVALYMAQVLKGLKYLHEEGVIHRDIKGANLLTTKDGTYCISSAYTFCEFFILNRLI